MSENNLHKINPGKPEAAAEFIEEDTGLKSDKTFKFHCIKKSRNIALRLGKKKP